MKYNKTNRSWYLTAVSLFLMIRTKERVEMIHEDSFKCKKNKGKENTNVHPIS